MLARPQQAPQYRSTLKQIALTPQQTPPEITLASMRVRRQPRTQAQERAREFLECVGLADQAFKRPPQLSGGQA